VIAFLAVTVILGTFIAGFVAGLIFAERGDPEIE